MSQALIREILESRLKEWAEANGHSVAWENRESPISPPFLQCFLLPAPTQSNDVKGDHRLFTGIFQVSVVRARNETAYKGEIIAAELEALFPKNLRVTHKGLTVQVWSPVTAARAIQDEDRYTIPVSFQYRADTI